MDPSINVTDLKVEEGGSISLQASNEATANASGAVVTGKMIVEADGPNCVADTAGSKVQWTQIVRVGGKIPDWMFK